MNHVPGAIDRKSDVEMLQVSFVLLFYMFHY